MKADKLLSSPTVESKSVFDKKIQRMIRPPGVTERDMEMFKKAQEQATLVSVFEILFILFTER